MNGPIDPLNCKRCISVEVRNNDVEQALRVLKRKLKKDNFFRELQNKEYYIKPSVERKLKKRRKKTVAGGSL